MNRKLWGSALFIALLLQTCNPAFAAPKSGGLCKKVGQISIQSGLIYTCVKSGKKLIWSKGKKVSPSIPKVNSTPSPSPVSLPPTSLEIEKIQTLLSQAFSNVKQPKSEIDVEVGPGAENQIIAQIVKKNLDIALRLSETMGLEFSKKYTVYVGDKEWLIPKMPANTWCSDVNSGVAAGVSAGFCGVDSGLIFVNRTGYLFDGTKPITRDFSQGYDRDVVAISAIHEVFHVVQAEISRKYAGTKGFFNPFWLNEGGANVAAALALSESEKIGYRQARTKIIYENCLQSVDRFKMRDFLLNTGNQGVCGPYSSGSLWAEYLIAKTGDIGALVNLAKVDRNVLNNLVWDPNNPQKYEEEKLDAILKSMYGLDFNTFSIEAEAYGVRAGKILLEWKLKNP